MEQVELDLYCVGVKHRMNRERRIVLAEILSRGPIPLVLNREQENKYDLNAIRVNIVGAVSIEGVESDHQLGYIASDTAAQLAEPLDAGRLIVLDADLLRLEDVTENNCKGVMHVIFGKPDAAG